MFRCWVSEFQALPDLDANANAVAIQRIKLENEGWERDYEVTEPSEPSFTSRPEVACSMRACIDTEALLTLWELGLGEPAGARDDALLMAAIRNTLNPYEP